MIIASQRTNDNMDELVRHRGEMSLLDQVVDSGETWLKARSTLTEHNLFMNEGWMPSWIGIEYMAQSIAAFAGTRAKGQNQPVKVGFLVGARKYEVERPAFPVGSILTVVVNEVIMGENGLGVFDCQLTCEQPDGLSFSVTTRLNVFQPDDFRDVFGA